MSSNTSRIVEKTLPRVIFIGESGVGKTSIIVRITTGVFDPSPAATIGAGVRPISITVRDKQHRFHLWDTAGQEIYRSIVPLYFKQAICAIVVFSLADLNSFNSIPEWIDLLNSHSEQNVPVVIVGNKKDVTPDKQVVEISTVKKFCDDKKYPLFFTSAVTGENIQNLFEFVAENYVARQNEPEVSDTMRRTGSEQGCC
ncbi:Ras-related protein Rab-6B [Tritrichomonas foetus]|uniref:Ras-related protein Rab-6B n=1 Tax=Tritrichomonas foetus TaxID=1144522 RepID=A0A1J4J6M1_9EUKA|nr:Ras-related protein Rab-6B [Tritrichomonas foetus]|eukprot:OHS92828.1 Ras-related protein Rab-6B [Tritrichomonas foetus]